MKPTNQFISTIFVFIFIGFIESCTNSSDNSVQIFAAAGTMLPVNKICNSFESEHGIVIEQNYAASGSLARQIYAGATADIYISANKQWIDFLIRNNLLALENVTQLACNKLVLICPVDHNININFSKNFNINSIINDKISIGDPMYVPVGKYAKQMFDSLNWYNKIENKIILAKDVSSVLNYVALKECDWGIVYYSEAIKSDKVKIIQEIPQELYSPITFYIGILNRNENNLKFYNYFQDSKQKGILNNYGFITN